jgi:hypothetical protein
VEDPSQEEFIHLFELYARSLKLEFRRESVQQLLSEHYQQADRPMRRCHPRDLLLQVRNYCSYHELPYEMKFEYLDRAARTYFGSGLSLGKTARN